MREEAELKGFYIPKHFHTHPRYRAAKEFVTLQLFGTSQPKPTSIHRVKHIFSARLGTESRIIEKSLYEVFKALPLSLKSAYMETNFNIDALNITLKISEQSSELMSLYKEKELSSAVFITAENPDSKVNSQADNDSAMSKINEYLQKHSYLTYEAFGTPKCGGWAGEKSYLVLGMPCCEAIWLASYFGQMAFVWCDADAIPLLVAVGGKNTQNIHLEKFQEHNELTQNN